MVLEFSNTIGAMTMKTPCILIALSLATTAFAADWYVAKDGDDNNSGATRAEA